MRVTNPNEQTMTILTYVIKLSQFMIIVLVGLGIINAQVAYAETANKINIIVIMADDLGYEGLSSNGSLDYKTPYLDKMAAEGFRFEHFYAQPLCTPTRVKLMTGMSNRRNYVKFGLLARDQKTFGNIFQDAGYKTCIAGKWQLGSDKDSPHHFGFQQALLWQHMRGRENKGHDTRFPNPQLEKNGELLDFKMGEFSSDLFTDFINDFITTNKDQPFFVYYPMALTHCPFSPTPDSEEWDPKSMGSTSYKGDAKYFKDMVAYVDKSVAKIDKKLTELGIRDNTLLIFLGDNGTDTPIVTNTTYGKVVGAKGKMIDGGNHVPCVVSWPAVIKKGTVTQDIADMSDILPTICDAAGIPLPSGIPFDGISFAPQLKGEKGTPRDAIYIWYAPSGGPKAKIFARNQMYKLYDDGTFFHVPSDLTEKKPLNDADLDDQAKAIKAMLQKKIDDFAAIEYLSSTQEKGGKSKNKSK